MKRVQRARRARDVPALIESLDVPRLRDEKGRVLPDVRMSALRALAKVGDERAVDPLIALLDDARTQVTATIALGRIGDPRAVPALLGVLGDHDDFAARLAAQKLPTAREFIHHPVATGRSLAADMETNLRGKALTSLAKLRAREVVPLLVSLLEHERLWVRQWAAELLAQVGDPVALAPLRKAERRTPVWGRRRIRRARRQLERTP